MTTKYKDITNDNKKYHVAVKYTNCPLHIPPFSIPRPSKIYQNGYF
jgi:hypothetical protein